MKGKRSGRGAGGTSGLDSYEEAADQEHAQVDGEHDRADAVGKKRVTVVYDAQDTQRNLCRHHQQRCADGGSWQYMQNTPVLSA